MSFSLSAMKLLCYFGMAIGAIVLAVIILFIVKAMDSKQGKAPGLINERLSACSSKPNCVSSEEGTPDEKQVIPFATMEGRGQQDWQRFQTIITEHGGQLIQVEDNYLSATFTSSVFGFVDDLEARIDSDQGIIQIRSSSRVGTSDFGANRSRVEILRNLYNNVNH